MLTGKISCVGRGYGVLLFYLNNYLWNDVNGDIEFSRISLVAAFRRERDRKEPAVDGMSLKSGGGGKGSDSV